MTVGYFDLGATLYTPCTHSNLSDILQGTEFSPRSIVLCLEDAVDEKNLPESLANLSVALRGLVADDRLKRFVRPRTPAMLSHLFSLPGIDKLDGFVLPKFDNHSFPLWEAVINEHASKSYSYLPILETKEVLDRELMVKLRKSLSTWGEHIVCLRIGGNDLLRLMGLKRQRNIIIYDTPIRRVIDELMLIFRTEGYELASPVFDIPNDVDTLERELQMDLSYGFYAKTAIHPSQIHVIERAYLDYLDKNVIRAESLISSDSSAVYLHGGEMLEKTCHAGWAERTIKLARAFR